MPGLKASKRQGIDNINEMMALRNNKKIDNENRNTMPLGENETSQELQSNKAIETVDNNAKRSALYEKQRASNGKNLRRRYDVGKLPRAHLELYREIVAALKGKKRDIVLLKPILAKLEMNYVTSAKVFSLLEEYEYLYFERAPNEQGRLLIIEVLRDI